MTEAPGDGSGPFMPRSPDPTAASQAATTAATEAFRREIHALRVLHDKDLAALKDLMVARMDAMDASTLSRFQQVTAASVEHATARDKAVTGLRDLFEERLDAVDRASQLLAQDLRQVPTAADASIASLRELMESKLNGMEQAVDLQNKQAAMFPVEVRTEISHLRQLHEERFSSIAQQFNERDIRTDQASRASKEALDAALQAAKELVNAQGEASSAAAVKSETSFAKQIDQIGTIISTLEKALDARITELKERVDRGEGSSAGSAGTRTDQRLNIGQAIAAVAVLVAIVSFILYAVKK
jgi:cation transport regulator ChaB